MKSVTLLILILFVLGLEAGCFEPQTRIVENKSIIGQWGYYRDTNDTEYTPGDYSVRWIRIIEFSDDGHFYKSDMAYVRQPETGELHQTSTEYSSGMYYFIPGTPGTYGEMGTYSLNGKLVEIDINNEITSILKNVEYTANFDWDQKNTIHFCDEFCDEYYPINSQEGYFDYPVTKTTAIRINVVNLDTFKETVSIYTSIG